MINPNAFALAKIRYDAAGPGRFLLGMGDSRTEQVPWAFVGLPSNRFEFVNWGIAGATTKDYRDWLIDNLPAFDTSRAFGAMINLGINDIWWGDQADVFVNFEQYYRDIIYLVAQRGHRVVCCTPTPLEKDKGVATFLTPLVDTISDKIRSLTGASGIPLVDFNAAFRQADHTALAGITTDGVHLSHSALAAHWNYMSPIVSAHVT